jgi:hypothetical protein
MPTYKVLRTIEHNHVVYLPAEVGAVREPPPAEKLPSGATGALIPVNASGAIELTEAEAAALDPVTHGQIPVLDGKPDSIEMGKAREAARLKADAATEASAKAAKKGKG